MVVPWTRWLTCALVTVLVVAACGPDDGQHSDAEPTLRSGAASTFRYDVEYPAIGYSSTPAANRVARLQRSLQEGSVALEFGEERGYLDSLLDVLDISESSQMLVFSKTSLQTEHIEPNSPRAIYFNDDTYVAFVPEAESLEIASIDAVLGPVFYTLPQERVAAPDFTRRVAACLRCHDSYSMTGGGVPRFITGSGYIGTDGNLVSHEGWILTSYKTPLRNRWGGWFVSGRHSSVVHLGNMIVEDVEDLYELEELRIGNLDSLEGLTDTSPYPTRFSDIVALLVLEQQTSIQNVMTRVSYDVRTLLDAPSQDPVDLASRIADITEPLVEAMFFAAEAELTDGIAGTSGYSTEFQARGKKDSRGRSLRDLDLEHRLFAYPLSYLVHSEAFDALPGAATQYLCDRFGDVLSGTDQSAKFAHLSADTRAAIVEILADTKPSLAACAELID